MNRVLVGVGRSLRSAVDERSSLEPMQQIQLNIFRQALFSLRGEIEQLVTENKEAAGVVALDQSKVGRLSRMDALQAQQMAQEMARRRQLQLQKIDSALRRMDAGEYGYCLACDDEIALARLDFDPASTRCINCADD
jgi:DnaK suppressor protein